MSKLFNSFENDPRMGPRSQFFFFAPWISYMNGLMGGFMAFPHRLCSEIFSFESLNGSHESDEDDFYKP